MSMCKEEKNGVYVRCLKGDGSPPETVELKMPLEIPDGPDPFGYVEMFSNMVVNLEV